MAFPQYYISNHVTSYDIVSHHTTYRISHHITYQYHVIRLCCNQTHYQGLSSTFPPNHSRRLLPNLSQLSSLRKTLQSASASIPWGTALLNSDVCWYGCFLKWWYPQNTRKLSFLVGKPMVVGYHHFRKPLYVRFNSIVSTCPYSINWRDTLPASFSYNFTWGWNLGILQSHHFLGDHEQWKTLPLLQI